MISRSMPLSRSTCVERGVEEGVAGSLAHDRVVGLASRARAAGASPARRDDADRRAGRRAGRRSPRRRRCGPARARRLSRATRPAASWRGVSGPNEPCCMSITIRASVMACLTPWVADPYSARAGGSRRHARPVRGRARSSRRCGRAGTSPAPNPCGRPSARSIVTVAKSTLGLRSIRRSPASAIRSAKASSGAIAATVSRNSSNSVAARTSPSG